MTTTLIAPQKALVPVKEEHHLKLIISVINYPYGYITDEVKVFKSGYDQKTIEDYLSYLNNEVYEGTVTLRIKNWQLIKPYDYELPIVINEGEHLIIDAFDNDGNEVKSYLLPCKVTGLDLCLFVKKAWGDNAEIYATTVKNRFVVEDFKC